MLYFNPDMPRDVFNDKHPDARNLSILANDGLLKNDNNNEQGEILNHLFFE